MVAMSYLRGADSKGLDQLLVSVKRQALEIFDELADASLRDE